MVVHPGNALKLDRMEALYNIAEALNLILTPDTKPLILLETMAGKGSECGINIYELKEILSRINLKDKVGICLDTCHLNDSGIDIAKFDEYLEEFAREIGIDKIKCIHVNDSKNPIASHKDRHANIGFGHIGFSTLISIVNNERLNGIPLILETPYIGNYDDDKNRLYPPYKYEILMLKNGKFKLIHSAIGFFK